MVLTFTLGLGGLAVSVGVVVASLPVQKDVSGQVIMVPKVVAFLADRRIRFLKLSFNILLTTKQ